MRTGTALDSKDIMSLKNYYEILGISFKATPNEINEAFAKKKKALTGTDGQISLQNQGMYSDVLEAFGVLSKRIPRNNYDVKYFFHFVKGQALTPVDSMKSGKEYEKEKVVQMPIPASANGKNTLSTGMEHKPIPPREAKKVSSTELDKARAKLGLSGTENVKKTEATPPKLKGIKPVKSTEVKEKGKTVKGAVPLKSVSNKKEDGKKNAKADSNQKAGKKGTMKAVPRSKSKKSSSGNYLLPMAICFFLLLGAFALLSQFVGGNEKKTAESTSSNSSSTTAAIGTEAAANSETQYSEGQADNGNMEEQGSNQRTTYTEASSERSENSAVINEGNSIDQESSQSLVGEISEEEKTRIQRGETAKKQQLEEDKRLRERELAMADRLKNTQATGSTNNSRTESTQNGGPTNNGGSTSGNTGIGGAIKNLPNVGGNSNGNSEAKTEKQGMTSGLSTASTSNNLKSCAGPYTRALGEGKYEVFYNNRLAISNPKSKDAIVKVINSKTGRTVRNTFIPAGNVCEINYLPVGKYYIKAYYGHNWDGSKKRGAYHGVFADAEEFHSYRAADGSSIDLSAKNLKCEVRLGEGSGTNVLSPKSIGKSDFFR